MDNLTHTLVGLAAAKAGLERLSPMATTVCVIAANAPDIDILATLGGKWFYLHHHRGITHSLIGTLSLAILVPTLFFAGDLVLARIRHREHRTKFRGLLIASLIMSASHPLMDWANNYGIRPYLPWNGQWFYGDLVFIVDPWVWLIVGGAAFLLTSRRTWQLIGWGTLAGITTGLVLFLPLQNAGLIYPNVFRTLWILAIVALVMLRTANLARRAGSSLAVVALALALVYCGGLAIAHRVALTRADEIARRLSTTNGETLSRVAAMPTLGDPFRWQGVADTDRSVLRFNFSITGNEREPSQVARFEKPRGRDAEAVNNAAKDYRAQIFLEFARFPATRVEGDCLSGLLVQFADLRYTEPGASRRGTFSLDVPVECDSEAGKLIEK